MGHQVRFLLACAILAGALIMGAGCKSDDAAATDGAAANPQTSKGGTGLAQQAPEMTPPEGAPSADDVVGSKTGG